MGLPPALRLYRGLATAAGWVGWPWFYWRLRRRGYGASFRPRLGLSLPEVPPPQSHPRLWLHGVSVGEISAAAPLIKELQARFPQAQLFLSTGTETGQAVARRLYGQAGTVFYYPVDVPWSVGRVLDRIQPLVYVALETEIWPNFLLAARQRGVKLALLNGRLSAKSFRNYLRIKDQFTYIINLFSIIGVSTPQDQERFLALGAPPARLVCTGNTKFDRWPDEAVQVQLARFRHCLQLDDRPVFLAASTHPGEEEIILWVYGELRHQCPPLLLFLAPRHPERVAAVGQLVSGFGLPWQLWQPLKEGQTGRQAPVILINTVGDLFTLYGLADLVFVGGSLVPHGGQNLLEPAVWGKVPMYGPHVANFRFAQQLLEEAGAALPVQDGATLLAAARQCLTRPEERQRLGQRGQAALQVHRGAAQRQADLLGALISDPGAAEKT